MPTKPIDRLMFTQGGLCFFCSMPLPKSEASVEHLVPISRAGSNNDDNCVACCKTVNALLGCMSLKEKIRVVLNQKGRFKCPNGADPARPTSNLASIVTDSSPKSQLPVKMDIYSLVIADLKKRGPSRPRKIETLKSTMRSTIKASKNSITDAQIESLVEYLKATKKITIDGVRIDYSL
ncbi:MAG: HNH endonuclease [Burkholderiaceae bacterium]